MKPFAATIVAFCRFVRSNGIPVGPKQSVDALRAAKTIGISDRANLMAALRAVICSSKAEWDLFDDLFNLFWNGTKIGSSSQRAQSNSEKDLTQTHRQMPVSFGGVAQHDALDPGTKSVIGAG